MIGKAASPSGAASVGADREARLPATAEIQVPQTFVDEGLNFARYEPPTCDDEADHEHDEFCPTAPFKPEDYTKGTFVAGSEANAHAAIWAYIYLRADGIDHADALEQAVQEAGESAACFAAIGSCGRGWCDHG